MGRGVIRDTQAQSEEALNEASVSGAQSRKSWGCGKVESCAQPGRATEPESEALRWEKLRWEAFLGLTVRRGMRMRGTRGFYEEFEGALLGVTGHQDGNQRCWVLVLALPQLTQELQAAPLLWGSVFLHSVTRPS